MDETSLVADTLRDTGLRFVARRVLPSGVWSRLRQLRRRKNEREVARRLRRLRRRLQSIPPGAKTPVPLHGYTVRLHHGDICYHLYEDIFVNRIYDFEAQRPDPLILDCGSNMGMSVLYFKHIYPRARIIGFEPDPAIFPYLKENVDLNRLTDVQLHDAAVAGKKGMLRFYSDRLVGSSLEEHLGGEVPDGWTRYELPVVRLRDYLDEPVDFLKMNIEGAEWDAVQDSQDRLRQVREMVIEYHHLLGLPRTLHKILEVLHREGFEYAVSDFGLATYGNAAPPVRLDGETRYFRHVYARRME